MRGEPLALDRVLRDRSVVAGGAAHARLVRAARRLPFGTPITTQVEEGKRSLIVNVDRAEVGRVREVNGRVVAIDCDYNWTNHQTPFDAVAHLIDWWVSL